MEKEPQHPETVTEQYIKDVNNHGVKIEVKEAFGIKNTIDKDFARESIEKANKKNEEKNLVNKIKEQSKNMPNFEDGKYIAVRQENEDGSKKQVKLSTLDYKYEPEEINKVTFDFYKRMYESLIQQKTEWLKDKTPQKYEQLKSIIKQGKADHPRYMTNTIGVHIQLPLDIYKDIMGEGE